MPKPLLPKPAKPSRQALLRQARVKRQAAKERFAKARRAATSYERQLKSVARQVKAIVDGFVSQDSPPDEEEMQRALQRYADLLEPWAQAAAKKMIAEVSKRDAQAWTAAAAEIGQGLRREMLVEPTGIQTQQLLKEQVTLIKSLPLKAAERAHEIAMEGFLSGNRASSLVAQLQELGNIAQHRARTIARTEVSRVGAVVLETRAEAVGSEEYIWHTAGDSDVREEHAILDGNVYKFKDPPVIGNSKGGGEIRGNPGTIYNCRCWAEPILPDVIL